MSCDSGWIWRSLFGAHCFGSQLNMVEKPSNCASAHCLSPIVRQVQVSFHCMEFLELSACRLVRTPSSTLGSTVESKHQGLVKVPISGFCFSFSSKRYDSRVRHFRSQPLEASAEDLKCCFALESLEPGALAAWLWRPFGTNSHHECVEGRELQGFVLMGTCQNVGPVRNCQKN